MDMPQKIKVACFDVSIEDWKPISAATNQKYGEFSSMEMLIRIDTSVDSIKVVDTLMHEINHAIYWAYGIEDGDNEERTVSTLSTGLVQVIRDNPDLLAYIQDRLKNF